MLKRVLLSLLVAVVTGILFYIIGGLLGLLPVVSEIGHFIQAVSGLIGLVGGIVFFVSGRTFWS